jgi:hypothetical protein
MSNPYSISAGTGGGVIGRKRRLAVHFGKLRIREFQSKILWVKTVKIPYVVS